MSILSGADVEEEKGKELQVRQANAHPLPRTQLQRAASAEWLLQ